MARRYFLRKNEVAGKLGVSVRTVERLVQRGDLTRYKTKITGTSTMLGIDRGSLARYVRKIRSKD